MKTLLTLFCLLSLSAFAREGHDTGGGGIGVKVGSKIFLYDFIESGLEEYSYTNESILDEMNAFPELKKTLLVNDKTLKTLSAKLNEVNKFSPFVAEILLKVIQDYKWLFINPRLTPTGDLGKTPILGELEQTQIAYRDDKLKNVSIDRNYFQLMPFDHQAGLILHEVLYAIDCMDGCANSADARSLVSYFFHPTFAYSHTDELIQRIKPLSIQSWGDGPRTTIVPYLKSCISLEAEASAITLDMLATQERIFKRLLNSRENRPKGCEFGVENFLSYPWNPAGSRLASYRNQGFSMPWHDSYGIRRYVLFTKLQCSNAQGRLKNHVYFTLTDLERQDLMKKQAKVNEISEQHKRVYLNKCLDDVLIERLNDLKDLILYDPKF